MTTRSRLSLPSLSASWIFTRCSSLLLCALMLLLGLFTTPCAHAQTASSWQAVEVAVGTDGTPRVLWTHPNGSVRVWTLSSTGPLQAFHAAGPYSGWTAIGISVGGDGRTRLLWRNTDGSIAVHRISSAGAGTDATRNFAPPAPVGTDPWSVVDATTGPDNKTRVLWQRSGGNILIWTLNASLVLESSNTYGPFTGYTAQRIAIDGAGKLRLQWLYTNGSIRYWVMNTDMTIQYNTLYAEPAGFTPFAMAVGDDGSGWVGWNSSTGVAELWPMSATAAKGTPVDHGPFTGWLARSMAVMADARPRVLWQHQNGDAQVWTNTVTGAFQKRDAYNLTPTSFTATAAVGQVNLSWAAMPNATGYAVYRSTSNAGPFALIASPSNRVYSDINVVAGTPYYYQVLATTGGVESGTTAVLSATPTGTSLAAPTMASTRWTTSKALLDWNTVTGATGYDIFQSTDPNDFDYSTPVLSTTSQTSATVPNLTNGTRYYFVVRAKSASGSSPGSASVNVTPLAAPTIQAYSQSQKGYLTWSAVTGAVAGTQYKVFQAATSGGYNYASPVATNEYNNTVYYADYVDPNAYFVVRTSNASGESSNSNQGVITSQLPPSGLTATSGQGQVNLTWTAVTGATKYEIGRTSTPDGTPTYIGESTTASYADVVAPADWGKTFLYAVRVIKGQFSESDYSYKVDCIPQTPALARSLAASGPVGQIKLSWSTPFNASATGYLIERNTGGPVPDQIGSTTGNTSTTFTDVDGGLINGTTYYYYVSALYPNGAKSSRISVAVTPIAAPVLTVVDGNALVNLTWSSVDGATSYRPERKADGGNWVPLGSSDTQLLYYNDTTVQNGSHYLYRVAAIRSDNRVYSIEKDSYPHLPPPPAAPTNPGATAYTSPLRIQVSWTAAPTADNYQVFRSLVSGDYGQTPTPLTGATAVTGTTFSDTTVSPGTRYYYKITATNAGGRSGLSQETNALVAPATPTSLAAQASVGSVSLSWTNSTGAATVTIRRAESTTGPFTTLPAITVAGTTQSTADNTVQNGHTYYYWILASNTGGDSAYSSATSAVTPKLLPTAPTGLVATEGDNRIDLSWSAASNAVSYKVKRAEIVGGVAGSYITLTTGDGTTLTNYADTTAVNGKEYYYKVSGFNGNVGGDGPDSDPPVLGKPLPTPVITVANPNPVTEGNSGQTQIAFTVTFSRQLTKAISFTYATQSGTAVAGEDFVAVNTTKNVPAGATTVDIPVAILGDTKSEQDETFQLVISNMVNAKAASGTSVSATGTIINDDLASPAIIGTSGNASVTINWNAVPGAKGYRVYRSQTSGSYTLPPIAYKAANVLTHTDDTVVNGQTYYYIVKAFDDTDPSNEKVSDASNEYEAHPIAPTPPPVPQNLKATAGTEAVPTSGAVKLDWSASAGATSYGIKRSTTAGGPYTTVPAPPATNPTTNTFTDTTAANGTQYFYKVFAINDVGNSADSTEVNATPMDSPVVSVVNGDSSITLNWPAVPGATSYGVRRSSTLNGTYTVLVPNTTTGTTLTKNTFTDTALTNGNQYFYKVFAINTNGQSLDSTAVSGIPTTFYLDSPYELTAKSGDSQVALTWLPVENATYKVFRASATGAYNYASPLQDNITTTSFTDTSAINGNTYFYVVRAYTAGGDSANSNEVKGTPSLSPQATTKFMAISTGSGKITLYWDKVDNATSYRVYRSLSSGTENYSLPLTGGPVPAVESFAGGKMMMWTDTSVTNNTEYFYTVKATNAAGLEGPASQEDSDVVDPLSTPWDSCDVSTIVSSLISQQDAADPDGDTFEAGGAFVAMGPDGAVYALGESSPQAPMFASGGAFTALDGSKIELPYEEDHSDVLGGMAASRNRTIETGKPSGGAWRWVKATPNQFRAETFQLQLPSASDVYMSPLGVASHLDTAHCYLGMGGSPTTMDIGLYNRTGKWEFYGQHDKIIMTQREHKKVTFPAGDLVLIKLFMDDWTSRVSHKRSVFMTCQSQTDFRHGSMVTVVNFGRNNTSFIPKRANQLAQNVSGIGSGPIAADAATGSRMNNIHWMNGRVFLNGNTTPLLWSAPRTYLTKQWYGANSNISLQTLNEDYNEVVSISTKSP